MLSTPKEAAIYTINTIKEIAPLESHDLDEDILEGVIEDIFYEQLNGFLTENDITNIEEHGEDEEYFREYCQMNIAKYYTMLEEITKNLITDYILEEKELHEPTHTPESDFISF